tara:strand:+ start:531 stop:1199 length:669 start_codon:yes stop_codon:yes gene_type:complete
MIIGNGLIAKSFKNYNLDCILFASGVSSSKEKNKDNFLREVNLLKETIRNNPDKKIVYFSTIMSTVDSSYYCTHKFFVENYISKHAKNYIIFRLPQVIGFGGNTHNIFNYIKNKAYKNESIDVYYSIKRSLIDVNDVTKIVSYCVNKQNRQIINIVGIEEKSVLDIAYLITKKINSTSYINVVRRHVYRNNPYKNCKVVDLAIKDTIIDCNNYTERIISKYI